MQAVGNELSGEAARIAGSLRQLAPDGVAEATLIILDRSSQPNGRGVTFPCFSVGCVALDANISVVNDGLVIPCLVPPVDFKGYRDAMGNHNSRLTLPDQPPEIVVPKKEIPLWRGWQIGSRAVEDSVWRQFYAEYPGAIRAYLETQFLPNTEALIMEARQTFELV